MPTSSPLPLRRALFTAVSALTLTLIAGAPVAFADSHSGGQSDHSHGTSGTSGSSSQPQPNSTADNNSGGANGQCPGGAYCSTRDGSASKNGNGNGKATGKPCAGCVGKADNKNPKGQRPSGTDHNAGYECDRNHGIGRSNPAHTGCTTPSTGGGGGGGGTDCTTNPTAAGCTNGGGGTDCTTNPTAAGCTNGGTTGGGGGDCTTHPTTADCAGNGGTGGPQCTPSAANHFCSTVLGEKQTRTPAAKVLSRSVTQPPASSALPFTGAVVVPMLVVGLGALAIGSLMLTAAYRRRAFTRG